MKIISIFNISLKQGNPAYFPTFKLKKKNVQRTINMQNLIFNYGEKMHNFREIHKLVMHWRQILEKIIVQKKRYRHTNFIPSVEKLEYIR